MDLNKLHRVHFLGIGGIGMSALARYFRSKDIIVSGYDKSQTPLTNELIDEGIKIHFEDNIDLIPRNIDLVVYTPAIPESNKEYQYFVNKNFELKKRAEVLGKITHGKFTIAVAGTHGKTTISSIIAHILKFAGKNITALIGGICKNYNSNFITSENTGFLLLKQMNTTAHF
jgi:UDP-N-acetylmuramate--alanine ligase